MKKRDNKTDQQKPINWSVINKKIAKVLEPKPALRNPAAGPHMDGSDRESFEGLWVKVGGGMPGAVNGWVYRWFHSDGNAMLALIDAAYRIKAIRVQCGRDTQGNFAFAWNDKKSLYSGVITMPEISQSVTLAIAAVLT